MYIHTYMFLNTNPRKTRQGCHSGVRLCSVFPLGSSAGLMQELWVLAGERSGEKPGDHGLFTLHIGKSPFFDGEINILGKSPFLLGRSIFW